jgi:hypothetical protein
LSTPITIYVVVNPAQPVNRIVHYTLYLLHEAQTRYPQHPRVLDIEVPGGPPDTDMDRFSADLRDALTTAVARYVRKLRYADVDLVEHAQDNDVPPTPPPTAWHAAA